MRRGTFAVLKGTHGRASTGFDRQASYQTLVAWADKHLLDLPKLEQEVLLEIADAQAGPARPRPRT